MSTAFQKNAFQNNAFQIGGNVADTHDGLPRKFYLPIYEYTKKRKKIEKIIEIEYCPLNEEYSPTLPSIPRKALEWDNSAIENFAKATAQRIDNVERQIEEIKKYEAMLDEDEDDLLAMALTIH